MEASIVVSDWGAGAEGSVVIAVQVQSVEC